MILAAATAIVGVAQLGVIMTARIRGLADAAYLAVPAVALVILCMLAWVEVIG